MRSAPLILVTETENGLTVMPAGHDYRNGAQTQI